MKCECGVTKTGGGKHSSWCPLAACVPERAGGAEAAATPPEAARCAGEEPYNFTVKDGPLKGFKGRMFPEAFDKPGTITHMFHDGRQSVTHKINDETLQCPYCEVSPRGALLLKPAASVTTGTNATTLSPERINLKKAADTLASLVAMPASVPPPPAEPVFSPGEAMDVRAISEALEHPVGRSWPMDDHLRYLAARALRYALERAEPKPAAREGGA